MSIHLPLPMSRVRTIMKSSADVDIVSKESIIVVTRAAEYFIRFLAGEAHKDGLRGKKLEYDNVANVVNNDNRYEFLREIIPRKITVAECFKIMKEEDDLGSESDDSESSTNNSEDGSSDSDVEQVEVEDGNNEGSNSENEISDSENLNDDVIIID